jgi:hypothetical protein
MKIELEISDNNEGTAYPWWLIVDPKQMMKPEAGYVAMGMITGPFFSREEAQIFLDAKRHRYSKRAVVWCSSGYDSISFRQACEKSGGKQ